MKLSLLLFLFIAPFCYGQGENFTCKFHIVDSKDQHPIPNASVNVDQAAKTISSGEDGYCYFKSVPMGRIDVNISHPNYKNIRVQLTVSPEIKNNSFLIELVPNSASSLLITGKVEDQSGDGSAGVAVEVIVDGTPYKSVSDESGNYKIDIPVKTTRSDRIQTTYKKGNCKYEEELLIPEQRYIRKNIKLPCADNNHPQSVDISGVWTLTIYSEYIISIEGPKKVGSHVGGMMRLKQSGYDISGDYTSSNSVTCKTGQVTGKVNPDGTITLELTCTKGYCSANGGYKIEGKIINNNIITGKNGPSPEPTGKCSLNIGRIELKRESSIDLKSEQGTIVPNTTPTGQSLSQQISTQPMSRSSCQSDYLYSKVNFDNKTGYNLVLTKYFGYWSSPVTDQVQSLPANRITSTRKLLIGYLSGPEERDFSFYFTTDQGIECKYPFQTTLKKCVEYTIVLHKEDLGL